MFAPGMYATPSAMHSSNGIPPGNFCGLEEAFAGMKMGMPMGMGMDNAMPIAHPHTLLGASHSLMLPAMQSMAARGSALEKIGLAYDLETTGLHDGCHLIQISVVPVNRPGIPPFVSYCMPDEELDPASQEVHGLTMESLQRISAPPLKVVMHRLVAWLNNSFPQGTTFVWCAHNGDRFDHPILKRCLAACGFNVPLGWTFVDSLPFARRVLNRPHRGCSLAQLHLDLCGMSITDAHDATADAVALANVWQQLVAIQSGLRPSPMIEGNGFGSPSQHRHGLGTSPIKTPAALASPRLLLKRLKGPKPPVNNVPMEFMMAFEDHLLSADELTQSSMSIQQHEGSCMFSPPKGALSDVQSVSSSAQSTPAVRKKKALLIVDAEGRSIDSESGKNSDIPRRMVSSSSLVSDAATVKVGGNNGDLSDDESDCSSSSSASQCKESSGQSSPALSAASTAEFQASSASTDVKTTPAQAAAILRALPPPGTVPALYSSTLTSGIASASLESSNSRPPQLLSMEDFPPLGA